MALDLALQEAALTAIQDAALEAFDGDIHSIILKGSALTEDFNPGFSDLDVHVYVPSEYMIGSRTPRLEFALAFQRGIGPLDPTDFGVDSFQVYFLDAEHYPKDWAKPVPGTYRLVYGRPIDDAASDIEHRERAIETLASIPDWRNTLIGRFLDKPDRALAPLVRLAGIILKGELYSGAVLATGGPQVLVDASLARLIEVVSRAGAHIPEAEAFFSLVAAWSTLQERPDALREAFRLAIQALDGIHQWVQPVLEKAAEKGGSLGVE